MRSLGVLAPRRIGRSFAYECRTLYNCRIEFDVLIPAHRKDFAVLRQCVRSVLRHVGPLRRVYVVSEERFDWPGTRVVWIKEPAASGVSLAEVRSRWLAQRPDRVIRAAWVYQQLVKLGADSFIDGLSPSYLVIDSDVIFLRPCSFECRSSMRFPYSQAFEHHQPYREAYRRLFGDLPSTYHSLTGHHMLYDQDLLSELKAEIERRHGRSWSEAYMDAIDYEHESSISEMDIYGWWVLERHPEVARHKQLAWSNVATVPGPLGRALLKRDNDFVAAHAWMRQSRLRRAGAAAWHLSSEIWASIGPGSH